MKRRGKLRTDKIVFVGLLLVVVILGVYLATRPVPTVQLPPYLDRCVPLTGDIAYDSRPQLRIVINGEEQTIPDGIGIVGTCVRPIFTLGTFGTIHVRTDMNRTYTLGDFFLVWGSTYGVQYAIFNKDQIFTYKTDVSHNITMTVSALGLTFVENRYQDFPLPINANTTSNPVGIVITYQLIPTEF